MNVLHVTGAFYPATNFGGPIYSVYALCNSLAGLSGINLQVLTTDSAGTGPDDRLSGMSFPERFPSGYLVYYCSRTLAPSLSVGMLFRLWAKVRWADVVHLTGVYSSPTIPTLLVCRLLGKPVVWSPRGALQRWEGATNTRSKKIWELACNVMIKPRRCVLHVTSEVEAADSKARILKADTVLIPNGVDFPESLPRRVWMPSGQLRLLYLGRLHPIKGIENLLRAVCRLKSDSLLLKLIGTGEHEYVLHLKQLTRELGIDHRVEFLGQQGEAGKQQAFLTSDLCVVPSFSENFCMVVAEALAHGVPVIASKGTPWSRVETHGCGLWVDNSPEQLASAIKAMRDKNLEAMGVKGREWMKEEYVWKKIAIRMRDVYFDL